MDILGEKGLSRLVKRLLQGFGLSARDILEYKQDVILGGDSNDH